MGKAMTDPDERAELFSALAEIERDLRAARSAFENACEPELVESSVFALRALETRQNYLLRRLRELEARAPLRFRPALRGEG